MSLVLGSRFGDVVGLDVLLLVDFTIDASVDDVMVRLLLASKDTDLRLRYLAGDGEEVFPTAGRTAREYTEWQAIFHPLDGQLLHAEDVEMFATGAQVHLPDADVSAIPALANGGLALLN